MNLIKQRFSVNGFDAYCQKLGHQIWADMIVLHNTASPSLAQRPGGILTVAHIQNLADYYEGKGWNGAPHLFIDVDGIWVFNTLERRGTHSPSYNNRAFGVEMLGDYDSESFTSGLGAKVRINAIRAVAALARMQGLVSVGRKNFILHKWDPKTDHDCPGKNVDYDDFAAAVNRELIGVPAPNPAPAPSLIVKGKPVAGLKIENGVSYAPVRALAESMGLKVAFDTTTNTVRVD